MNMQNMEEMNKMEESDGEVLLVITEDIRSYIYDTAKWTRFLAVVGFIFSAFTAMFAFSSGAFLSTMTAVQPNNPMVQLGQGGLMVMFLIFALLYFYPSLLLFNYSSAAKNAVLYGDQSALALAMDKMK